MLRWLILMVVASAWADESIIMSHIAADFGKSLNDCREESGLTVDVMEEFHHFWNEDFEVSHHALGCALICMSRKISLLQDDGRMHHFNMNDYIKSFPNGEVIAEKVVQMIHNCEKQYDDMTDDCDRIVKIASCFKENAKSDGVAPDVAMIEAILKQNN